VVEGGRATRAGPRLASLTDASMAAPQLGSYSSSTALSPQHYKLVHQVEQACTAEVSPSSSSAESPELMRPLRPQDTNRVLLDCLVTIKTSWAKRAPSPVRPHSPRPLTPKHPPLTRVGDARTQSTARHDLVLVLYARSQRAQPLARPLDPVAEELFEAAWALPVAVKLAGGAGRADLTNRNLGAFSLSFSSAAASADDALAGYRACTELFSPLEPHSLKLLLVNTIRSVRSCHPSSPSRFS